VTWVLPTRAGPDEHVYALQGAHVARGGLGALRRLAGRHAAEPLLSDRPSPLRWGWLLLLAAVLRVAPRRVSTVAWVSTAGHLACIALAGALGGVKGGLLAACSPLSLLLARRALGDTWAAAGALAVLLAVASSAPWWAIALVTAGAVALKETNALAAGAAVVAFPSWAAAGSVALGGAVALGAAAALLGVQVLRRLLALGQRQGDTAYSREHQAGGPHRLIVDLAILSPCIAFQVFTLWGRSGGGGLSPPSPLIAWALALLVGIGCAPIQNVRIFLGAELALRIAVGALSSWVDVAVFAFIDLMIAARLARVYDPVTAALVWALFDRRRPPEGPG
jgi:hypothetical protein